MKPTSRWNRLIHGSLGAALAALLGAAHAGVRPPAQGPVAAGAIGTISVATPRTPELRAASERIPKAPAEKAARTRRPSTASAAGILPAPLVAGAVSAPVVLIIRGTVAMVSPPSECGHCTRAPRPPPIS